MHRSTPPSRPRFTRRHAVLLAVFAILAAGACLPPLTGAAESNYSRFVAAHRARDYAAALRWIEAAAREPGAPGVVYYWHGIMLHMCKRWTDAARVFTDVPPGYLPAQTAWYRGDCLLQLGRLPEARSALELGLAGTDTADKWQRHVYVKLVDVLDKLDDTAGLRALEPRAAGYAEPLTDDLADFLRYRFARLYLDRAVKAAERGDAAAGDALFADGLRAAGRRTGKYAAHLVPGRYVNAWHKRKDWARALAAYDLLPEVRRQAWQRYVAVDAALALGRTNTMLDTAERELPRIDDDAIRRYVWHKLVRCLVDLGDLERLARHEAAFIEAFRGRADDYAGWLRLAVANRCLARASALADRGERDGVEPLLARIERLRAPGFGKYAHQAADMDTWRDAVRAWNGRHGPVAGEVRVKLLVLVFERLRGRWTDTAGVTRDVDNRIPAREAAGYQASFTAARQMLAHLSGGKLVVDARIVSVGNLLTEVKAVTWRAPVPDAAGKITEVPYFTPVLATARPAVGAAFFTNRNACDGFVTVFPSQGITGTCTGGLARLEYVPGKLRSKVFRLNVVMAGTAMGGGLSAARVLVHELFHNVEGTYRDRHPFTSHVYLDGYRAHWPAWFRGGGEFAYYREAFRVVAGPAGLARLRWSDKADPVTPEQYRAAGGE